MLIELTAYYVGEPAIKASESFWLYTNLSKQQLAQVICLMREQGVEVTEDWTIACINNLALKPGHEWIKAVSIHEFIPVQNVKAELN
jgi:hypothetical protein